MFRKITLSLLPLCALLLLTACTNQPPVEQPGTEASSASTPVTEAPTESETTPDTYAALRDSGETWIECGLAAYESGREVRDLSEFFATTSNLPYLTLYDHMFAYDKQTSTEVAEAFFAFVCDTYGPEAVLDLDRRIEYKTAYLASLGVETGYVQNPDVERFFNGMEFRLAEGEEYPYIFTFGKAHYYFRDFSEGSPTMYHGFLYHTTTGLDKMITHLKTEKLTEGLDTEREFHFFMVLDGKPYSVTRHETGYMYINSVDTALHEAMHAMGIHQRNNIWLSEGLCDYFGDTKGFNQSATAQITQVLSMAQAGYFDEQAEAGDTMALRYKALCNAYTAHGGTLGMVSDFDGRLYFDVAAALQLSGSFEDYTATLGSAYEAVNGKPCTSPGHDLTYEQACSLVAYLIEQHGADTVMAAYRTQDIAGTLGQNYEGLLTDWIAYIQAFDATTSA